MSNHNDDRSARDQAMRYAWDWFSYHAKQRLDVFRFYLIFVALVLAGVLRLLEKDSYFLSITLTIFLMCGTFLFYRFDRRNSALVKLGEYYLKREEKALSEELDSQEILILSESENKGKHLSSFSQLFRYMFLAVTAIAACTLLVSANKWLEGNSEVASSTVAAKTTRGTDD